MVQIFDVPVAARTYFREKAHYRESLSLTVGLTVGFGSVAAANPNTSLRWNRAPCPRASQTTAVYTIKNLFSFL
jgi:hypothetical protein